MEELKIEVKRGKELTEDYIKLMENARIEEYGLNTKDFRNKEKDSVFFFVNRLGKIVSFGMLKPVRIEFNGEIFDILGISSMLSLKKGKGYGLVLAEAMIEYLEKSGKSGLGFCEKKVSGFYDKCGFEIIESFALRFRQRGAGAKEKLAEHEEGWYGVCFNGKDNFIRKAAGSDGVLYIDGSFW